MPTAIGAGIGVPLGIASIDFLVIFFSKKSTMKNEGNSMSSSHASDLNINVDTSHMELRGIKRPYEMEGMVWKLVK